MNERYRFLKGGLDVAIELFAHNQKAYESALQMLEDEHKTAVIHPTGTGKSFIGFQFVDEHPDWKICWISPSDYIFQTQLENVSKVKKDISFSHVCQADEHELGGAGCASAGSDHPG